MPRLNQALVLRAIEADVRLRELFLRVTRRRDADASHDVGHLLRVTVWTLRIGGRGIDRREGMAAALLHDLVNVPKRSPLRPRASELSANAARPLLRRCGFGAEAVDRITGAIRDHSFSRGVEPASALGRALQDADRLDALGSIGIFRAAASGVSLGSAFLDVADPWASRRRLDDRAYVVDHFFTKLMRLPASMRTAKGRAEATRRAAHMTAFLRELGVETGSRWRGAVGRLGQDAVPLASRRGSAGPRSPSAPDRRWA